MGYLVEAEVLRTSLRCDGVVRDTGEADVVAEVKRLESLRDGGIEFGVGGSAGGDGEGAGEGGLLVEGEGGGVDGGEVVELAGDKGVGVVDGVGCVVLVGGEEDLGVEVAFVA